MATAVVNVPSNMTATNVAMRPLSTSVTTRPTQINCSNEDKRETFTFQRSNKEAFQEIDFTSQILAIAIGETRTRFLVHTRLFTLRSALIRDAATTEHPGRNGPEPPTLLLERDNAEIFRLYVNYVYTRCIIISRTSRAEIWISLIDLYVLANYLQDREAENGTIEGMHAFSKEENPIGLAEEHGGAFSIFSAAAVVQLYQKTGVGSQARKFLVDVYASRCPPHVLASEERKWPADFIFDVALRLIEKRSSAKVDSAL